MDFYNKNNLFRRAFLLLITPVLFFSIFISLVQAESGVPSILSYQGRLTDSSGNLLGGAGTPYFFKFSFWDSATVGSGSQVWPIASPAPVSLTVKQGVFNVNIGDIENSYPDILNYNFGSNKKIYLQVEASANNSSFETLSPRQRITSAPFAEVAGSLAPDYLTSIFSNYFTKTESNNLYDFLGAASTTASTTITNHENIFNHNLISTALQSFTELDPVWSASSWASTTNNSANWNTAFGWGNHAGLYDLLGTASSTASLKQDALNGTGFIKANGTSITYDNNTYLTAETDPLFIAWDKHAGISVTESQISDLKSYLTAESDTLASITARGASTSVESTFSGGLVTSKIRPATDSTTALQFTKADGVTNILNIDTTNGNVGIGITTPGTALTLGSGQITVPDGSFSAPAYSFNGSTNTGIYKSGAGMYFSIGGSVRYGITSAENITYGPLRPSNDDARALGTAAYRWNSLSVGTGNSIFQGNVGIGTSSPTEKLEVNGDIKFTSNGNGFKFVNPGDRFFSPAQGQVVQEYLSSFNAFTDSNNNNSPTDILFSVREGDTYANIANTRSLLAIQKNGKVGIGTTTPGRSLTVSGDIELATEGAANRNFLVTGGYDLNMMSAGNMNFAANSFTPLRLFKGNLALTIPGQNFNIGAADDADLGFFVDRTAATTWRAKGSGSVNPTLIRSNLGNLRFYADSGITANATYTPTERMVIQSNGNVGIGTTSPTEVLDVVGNIKSNGNIYTSGRLGAGVGTVANPSFYMNADTNTGVWMPSNDILHLVSGGAERLSVIANGNVGIGTTSPSQLFTVGNNDQFTVDETGRATAANLVVGGNIWTSTIGSKFSITDSNINFTAASKGIVFNTNSIERVRIDSSGNVGIGTITPTQALDVDGGIQGQDFLFSNSTVTSIDVSNGLKSVLPPMYGSYADQTQGKPITVLEYDTNGLGTWVAQTVSLGQVLLDGTQNTNLTIPAATAKGFRITVNVGSYRAPNMFILEQGWTASSGSAPLSVIVETSPDQITWTNQKSFTTAGSVYGSLNHYANLASISHTPSIYWRFTVVRTDLSAVNNLYIFGLQLLSSTNMNGAVYKGIPINWNYAGNIGIGTITPNVKLEVSQALDGGAVRVSSLQNDTSHSTSVPHGSFEVYSADGSGGGVGVRGALRVYPASAGGASSFMTFSNRDGTSLELERMRIDYNGNIGIGTTLPASKLDVVSASLTTSGTVQGNVNIGATDGGVANVGGALSFSGYVDNPGTLLRTFATVEGRKEADGVSSSGYLSFKTNFAGTLNEQMRIDSGGNISVGRSTGLATNHGLDISSGGFGLVLGADSGTNTRTNSIIKYARVVMPHYTNAEEPFSLLYGTASSANTLNIGGGMSNANAANYITFYAATNTTALSGTVVGQFTSTGLKTAGASVGVFGGDLQNMSSNLYVQSRLENLTTNGSGLMGNNYNFTGFTFDQVETHGGGGSFRVNVSQGVRYSDEYIPVDNTKTYKQTVWAKSGDVGGGNFNPANKQYIGQACYDIDLNPIGPENVNKYAAAVDTTLAAPLNPGDTTITLTDATGWYNSTSATSRQMIWYGYTNAKGYTYPDYSYSRNFSGYLSTDNGANGTWAAGGITGNVITLRNAWTGPALSAGQKVRNSYYSATLKYNVISSVTVPNTWTQYTGTMGPASGYGSDDAYEFRAGTAFVKWLFLINYHLAADTNVRFSDMTFNEVNNVKNVILRNQSADEIAYQFDYQTNKSAGLSTGLRVKMIDSSTPAGAKLMNLGMGTSVFVSKWNVDTGGTSQQAGSIIMGSILAGARTISLDATATDVAGKNLDIYGGSTIAGTAVDNVVGGALNINAGAGTGLGASTINFKTGTTLASGKTLQTLGTKMTILGNGNVGIGTTSPVEKLTVVQSADNNGISLYGYDDMSSNYLKFYISDLGHVYMTTASTKTFFFQGGGNLDFKNASGYSVNFNYGGDGDVRFFAGTSYPIYFKSSTGNVGIGTTSPAQALDVVGSIRSSSGTYLTNSTGVFNGYTNGNITFGLSNIGNALVVNDIAGARHAISTGGYDLTFSKHKSGDDTYYKSLVIHGNAADNYPQGFSFYTGTTEKVTILGNGNVGIGTTTPGQVLTVVGNGQFTAVGSGASANDLRITADGTLTTSASDIALKMNLIPLNATTTSTSSVSILDKVLGLKPYTFNWISDPTGQKDIGLIAQDVEGIFPEITFTNKVDGYKGINYSRLPVILVSAIQELSDKVVKAGSYVVDGVAHYTHVIAVKFTGEEAEITNIKTQKVCIGETCIDEAMLKEIILKNSITNTVTTNISDIPEAVVPPTGTSTATTTDPTASTTEEVITEATSTDPIVEEVLPAATSTEPVVEAPVVEVPVVEPVVETPAVVPPTEPVVEAPPAVVPPTEPVVETII